MTAAIPWLAGAAVLSGSWGLWCLYWHRKAARAARERIQTGLNLQRPSEDLVDRLRAAVADLAIAADLEKRLNRGSSIWIRKELAERNGCYRVER